MEYGDKLVHHFVSGYGETVLFVDEGRGERDLVVMVAVVIPFGVMVLVRSVTELCETETERETERERQRLS